MRLLRLRLENIRGVKDRSLTFSPDGQTTGVVIVEGRNEAGKSTLGDALDTLLTCKDSANRAEVRSLQTAGEDEAPVVEAELKVGAHRFVYRKRFIKQRSTSLRILEPRNEDLSGEAAHERVEQILDAGIDRALWSSLRLRQGDAIEQADVGQAQGLAAALSAQTDAGVIGDRELATLAKVQEEYERYFQPRAKGPKPVLRAAKDGVETLTDQLAELEERRAALEGDVEHADRLERSLPKLRAHVTEAEAKAQHLRGKLTKVEDLVRRVEECQGTEDSATSRLDNLTEQRDRREALIAELSGVEEKQSKLTEALDTAEAARAAAAQRFEEAVTELESAKQRHREAQKQREKAQRDLDHVQARHSLEGLCARVRRATDATSRLREADAAAAAIAVDEALLEVIREAHNNLIRAQAALDAASPQLRFTASQQVTLETDDGPVDLAAGDARQWTVRGTLRLRIPDTGELEVAAGGGIEDAVTNHGEALDRWREALERGGIDGLSAAEHALRDRRDAEHAADDARRERDDALGDATIDDLSDEVERLERLVARFTHHRQAAAQLPGDMAAAREALDEARKVERGTADALAVPEASLERVRKERDRRQQAAVEERIRVEEAANRATVVREELQEARRQVADAELMARVGEAESACAAARSELQAAQEELRVAEPETVRSLADNAAEVAADARTRLVDAERDLQDTRVRIEVKGGEGLHEKLLETEAALSHARAALDGLQRRANAAAMLRERLEHHRGIARERYAAPLKEQLLAYGRTLYGPGFDIELDDDLRVVRRRHDGLWLEVTQLSVGAREQLALIGRLACATLLGEQGGLLLFDDALGNTDPDRLERIGAVLRLAGEHCQIVVLTSYPDRYRHVGGAARIAI